VIAILEQRHLCLVELGVLFQPCNPFLDGMAKSRADLKAFNGRTIGDHGKLLKKSAPLKKYF
jgi:hypothetical protein